MSWSFHSNKIQKSFLGQRPCQVHTNREQLCLYHHGSSRFISSVPAVMTKHTHTPSITELLTPFCDCQIPETFQPPLFISPTWYDCSPHDLVKPTTQKCLTKCLASPPPPLPHHAGIQPTYLTPSYTDLWPTKPSHPALKPNHPSKWISPQSLTLCNFCAMSQQYISCTEMAERTRGHKLAWSPSLHLTWNLFFIRSLAGPQIHSPWCKLWWLLKQWEPLSALHRLI